MTFGFSTLIDALSWVIVLTLGLKVVATVIVLAVDKDMRDRPGWGSWLWWSTKITPLVAAPCLIALALLQHLTTDIWLFGGLTLFVVLAVSYKVRQRRNRIAKQLSAKPLL